jgi:hypothetical protein
MPACSPLGKYESLLPGQCSRGKQMKEPVRAAGHGAVVPPGRPIPGTPVTLFPEPILVLSPPRKP